MHCVVTAGPTYEPLDRVRRLTNFSTGRLGTKLAGVLAARGHQVTLLLAELATCRTEAEQLGQLRIETFTTTASLRERLQVLAGQPVDAVFHAAAVSDFAFGKVWRRSPEGKFTRVKSGKIPTREAQLLVELAPTPKIISELRGWFPQAWLVGWKFEVDGDQAAAVRAAERQMDESRTNACVANGPAYGAGFGLVTRGLPVKHFAEATALCEALERLLR